MSSWFTFCIVRFKELFSSVCFLKINILHLALLWWFVLRFRNAKQLHNKSLEECTWGLFVMVINKWTLGIVDKQKIMDNSGRLSKRSEHDFSSLIASFILLSHNPLEALHAGWLTASPCWQLIAKNKLQSPTCSSKGCPCHTALPGAKTPSTCGNLTFCESCEGSSSYRCLSFRNLALTVKIKWASNLDLCPLESSMNSVHYGRDSKLQIIMFSNTLEPFIGSKVFFHLALLKINVLLNRNKITHLFKCSLNQGQREYIQPSTCQWKYWRLWFLWTLEKSPQFMYLCRSWPLLWQS